jgi:hypothetical protein
VVVHIVTTGLQRIKAVPVAGSVIDLTGDSPVNQLAPVENAGQTSTNQSVIFLDDSMDVSSPAKQARYSTFFNVISFELLYKKSRI